MNASQLPARESAHDAEVDEQLCAYNAAFEELGLRFRWDERTLASLAAIHDEHEQIAAYIGAHHAHLLKAYSAEFLSLAILERKRARCPLRLVNHGGRVDGSAKAVHPSQSESWFGAISYGMELPALAGA